ncbi:hypothetical protein BRYFOR_07222 [Marvinbryantia formatexigens DSM 14469]|uniref:Uncharacterized protein n=1 Tax=Marvinbryantia formatexigens DSM 14469 TaxID=478749 RepID=C6LF21_9FIRM|nr:hypothetical protein BRYFOR_07222 [Marvinbryantia formatexigens DSM 14469]
MVYGRYFKYHNIIMPGFPGAEPAGSDGGRGHSEILALYFASVIICDTDTENSVHKNSSHISYSA